MNHQMKQIQKVMQLKKKHKKDLVFLEIRKVKKKKLIVGAAVGAGEEEIKRAKAIVKENINLIVVDTAHGHSKKVAEIIKKIKKRKKKKKSSN